MTERYAIILRRCNTFKKWSVEIMFPSNIINKKNNKFILNENQDMINFYLNFKDLQKDLPKFIGLERKVKFRYIDIGKNMGLN